MVTQQAHDVDTTSHQRRCNVMTLNRRWFDVVLTLLARWVDKYDMASSRLMFPILFSLHCLSTWVRHINMQLQGGYVTCFFFFFFFLKCAHFSERSIQGKGIDFSQIFPTKFHETKCIALANINTFHKHTAYRYPHYENMPIQIYWKFYHQKMKIFR